jgi:hypothetical protein
MRGIAPIIAFVLVLAISMMASLALYYFVIGAPRQPGLSTTFTVVQASLVNTTTLRIINIGTTNTTTLAGMNTTLGNCLFVSARVLQPGISEFCYLPVASASTFRVWATGVNTVSVVP